MKHDLAVCQAELARCGPKPPTDPPQAAVEAAETENDLDDGGEAKRRKK